jgi:hypothetical protein
LTLFTTPVIYLFFGRIASSFGWVHSPEREKELFSAT